MLRSSQLPCGADVDDLLEQAAEGHGEELDQRQRHCVHCQAALREFNRIWAPVRAQAAETVTVPALLTLAVQGQVRKLVADVWYTLQLTDGGQIRVAARVVANLARAAAHTVPGVRVAFGRSSTGRIARLVERATLGHLHPHAAVGVLGRTAVLDLALAVEYGQPVDDIASEVQHRVIMDLRKNVGLQDITVNITVDDILA
ncbi:MAG: Asp23/Gls24 family envelope stress response protein [Jatrophihabitans sp.]